MPNGVPFCTKLSKDGTDIGQIFVDKDYLVDVYPNLSSNLKASTLWSWGYSSGTQGDNQSASVPSSPTQTIAGGNNWRTVADGRNFRAGIKSDGTLWIWGSSFFGKLGNNSTVTQSSPVQTVSGGTNWDKISLGGGGAHAGGIKTDGTLWTWGQGDIRGDTISGARSSPGQTIALGTNWKDLDIGSYHVISLKMDGTLWTWGTNYCGKLGDNTASFRNSPVQTIAGGNNWSKISSRSQASGAIKSDGTLWLWGRNSVGILGNNSTISASSPIQTISGGNNWKQVSVGCTVSAVKTDGTLWLWGYGGVGGLGNLNTIPRSSPVQTITGGSNWKCTTTGGTAATITFAIKTDGTLWAWGFGTGRRGDNNFYSLSSPVQTISKGTDWKAICSGYGGIAIREEGGW